MPVTRASPPPYFCCCSVPLTQAADPSHPPRAQLLDENLDGLISLPELIGTWKRSSSESAALALPPESELRQMFVQADVGKDGFLDDDEFSALVNAVYKEA